MNTQPPPSKESSPPEVEHMLALFEYATERFADRRAFGSLRDGTWDWITYRQFAELVAQCRAGLAVLGVGRGDRVAVISNNRLEWVVVAHAVYQRRAIFVPMAEAQAESEWNYVLGDAAVKVCFAASVHIAQRVQMMRDNLFDLQELYTLDGAASTPRTFASLLAKGAERTIKARTPNPADPATIIYTSGTTGTVKGVRLTHANLAYQASALCKMRDYGRAPRSVSYLPWAHVFGGAVELNVAMLTGTSVAICAHVEELFRAMRTVRPTVLCGVPRIWNQFYTQLQRELGAQSDLGRRMFDSAMQVRSRQASGKSLSLSQRMTATMAERTVISKLTTRLGGKLDIAISGAAPLAREVAEFMDGIGITILEGYGLTESSGSSTANPVDAPRFGSVGKPLPGTRIEIDSTVPEAQGERDGEVIIYGPGVMAGYHNQPEATKAVLTTDGGLRTGDLGYLDEDGYLHITGRIKELFKLDSGRYIAPGSLERRLCLSPFIPQCMVYGAGRPYNVALVVVDFTYLRAFLGGDQRSAVAVIEDERTRRIVSDEIARHSRDFRTYELIRDFSIVAEPFTVENRMVTPTDKLRRQEIVRVYGPRLEALYRNDGS